MTDNKAHVDLSLFTSAEPSLAVLLAKKLDTIESVQLQVAPSMLAVLDSHFQVKSTSESQQIELMSGKQMKILFQAISSLPNLQSLTLQNFQKFCFPVKIMASAIAKCESLRQVTLNSVNLMGKLRDLESFATSIGSSSSLQVLELINCKAPSKNSDRDFTAMFDSPTGFRNLRKLVLKDIDERPFPVGALILVVRRATKLSEITMENVCVSGETKDFQELADLLRIHREMKRISLWDCWPASETASFNPLVQAISHDLSADADFSVKDFYNLQPVASS